MVTHITQRDCDEIRFCAPRDGCGQPEVPKTRTSDITRSQIIGIIILAAGFAVDNWFQARTLSAILFIFGCIVTGRSTWMDIQYVSLGLKPTYSWVTKTLFVLALIGLVFAVMQPRNTSGGRGKR